MNCLQAAAAMRRAHPHALFGGCRWSLARDSGIIAAIWDDAGASSSMPREEVSVKHNQLELRCRYADGKPTHRAMEASEGHLTTSPVFHRSWPATSPSIDQAGSNHTPRPLAASPLTQAWCILTRSGQVDSHANRQRQRQRLLVPAAVGAPSEGDFQAEGRAVKEMKFRLGLELGH